MFEALCLGILVLLGTAETLVMRPRAFAPLRLPSSLPNSPPSSAWTATSLKSVSDGKAYGNDRGLSKVVTNMKPLPSDPFTLYVKPAADGVSVGDCPFAHAVRSALDFKGIKYELLPTSERAKPGWLIDYFDGALPALRHGSEVYTTSTVIMQYLDFFFTDDDEEEGEDSLGGGPLSEEADEAVDGFFPSLAAYIKNVGDDAEDLEKFKVSLAKLEDHINVNISEYLTGETVAIVDLLITPQLHHMKVALDAFKDYKSEQLFAEHPNLKGYYDRKISEGVCFSNNKDYDDDVIVWGWGQARDKQQ